jgi:hypothetical protein
MELAVRRFPAGLALLALLSPGCAVTAVAGAVVETGASVAKTGAKAGGAVVGGAIDAVDSDAVPEEEKPAENNP